MEVPPLLCQKPPGIYLFLISNLETHLNILTFMILESLRVGITFLKLSIELLILNQSSTGAATSSYVDGSLIPFYYAHKNLPFNMFILQFLLCSINCLYLLFNIVERQLLINDRLDEPEPYCLSSLQAVYN